MAHDTSPQRDAQKASAFLNAAEDASNPVRFYEFGEFRVDAKRRLLTRNGEPIAVKPKALDTLLLLIQHRDRVMEKEELMTRLWPDTIVEEANLTQNVFVIRKALGEGHGEARFIATVARQGYRFVGDVREVQEEAPASIPAVSASGESTAAPASSRRGMSRARLVTLGAVAVVLAAVGLVAVGLWRARSQEAVANTVRSIAVLPFRNSSGNAEDDYFAEGVTDAITADLASISALRVISRQSVARFRGSDVPLPEIARMLGVDALVEGAVARSGGRIRVTVQLLHGATDRHLWAESYDRDLGDVLALQGQLARAVAEAIRARVSDAEHAGLVERRPVDPEAYSSYLRGKHFLNRRGDGALRRSVELFQDAVARDPTFAAAHGEMAVAYQLLSQSMPRGEGARLLRAAATTALALDPRQADARAALAFGVPDNDAAASLARIEAVARDNPNHALSRGWYGSALIESCRSDAGLVQRRLSVQLDPLSPISHLSLGLELARQGRYDEALAALGRALELDPDYADAHGTVGFTYLQQGKRTEAIEKFETCARLSRNSPRMVARLAHAYGLVGRADEARALLRSLDERSRTEPISPALFAHVHAGLGEADRAFQKMEEAIAEGYFLRLNADPLWIPLYKDPRFAALGRRSNQVAPCPGRDRAPVGQ